MGDRRDFIGTLAGSVLLATAFPASAQVPGRIYRLGVLRPSGRALFDENIPRALGERGYVEGRNLIVERRYAEGRIERLMTLAGELVSAKVDAIVAVGSGAVRAAMGATSTIPIVMFGNFDPLSAGFVKTLGRPGGNVTGVLIAPNGTLAGKKLELLREAVPRASRIALLIPDDPSVGSQLEEIRKAGSPLGLALVVIEVRKGNYEEAFARLSAERPQALFVTSSTFFVRDRTRIIELAARYRLPAIYEWREHVADGGLMTYAPSLNALHRRVADYVGRIFEGADPAELPVEQPTKFELVINLRTARALGLALPQSLLLRADELIE